MTTQDIKKAWKSTLVMGLTLMGVMTVFLLVTALVTRHTAFVSDQEKAPLLTVIIALLTAGACVSIVSYVVMVRSK